MPVLVHYSVHTSVYIVAACTDMRSAHVYDRVCLLNLQVLHCVIHESHSNVPFECTFGDSLLHRLNQLTFTVLPLLLIGFSSFGLFRRSDKVSD